MEAPRLVEEEASIGRNSRVLAKNMVERRHVSPLRVGTLYGLLELARIAEQDEALRGLRYGEDVGK
jgi:hypothetical protein